MSINRSNISQEVNKPGVNKKKMFTPPKDTQIPTNKYKMMKPQNQDTQNLLKLLQNN
tara:strand:+ start:1038 stop:1208 length:171 start_codon:yes stop_codon:yes gene_type:complete